MIHLKYMLLGLFVTLLSSFISIYIGRKKPDKPVILWWLRLYTQKSTLVILTLLGLIEYLLLRKHSFTTEFTINSLFICLLLTIAIYDIKNKIIPNLMIAMGVIISIISILFNYDISIYNAILGALIPGGLLVLISLITKGALGMGDAKLFMIIGFFVGLKAIFSVLFLSTLLIGILSLILMTFKVVNRKATIPFAPFIFVATFFINLL